MQRTYFLSFICACLPARLAHRFALLIFCSLCVLERWSGTYRHKLVVPPHSVAVWGVARLYSDYRLVGSVFRPERWQYWNIHVG